MRKNIVWIESGKESLWLAKAISGAFTSSFIIDCDKLEKDCVRSLVPQIKDQSGFLAAICKSPIAFKKEFGGIALLPYGSKTKITMKDVLIHEATTKKNEKDKIVEKVLAYMKDKKII